MVLIIEEKIYIFVKMKKDIGISIPKISVLTPTCRPGGLKIVDFSLGKQIFFSNFEWVIVSSFKPITITPSLWVKDPPGRLGDYWNFNKAMNAGLRKCRGELIISWQDYIWGSMDTLETFWFWHKHYNGLAAVTGVGDQYGDIDERGIPTNKIWGDPRKSGFGEFGSHYEIKPVDWEANFAMMPKQAFYDVGGFDEELDKWAGMDNVSLVERVDFLKKYKFYIDHSLECKGYKHDRPPKWNENHAMFEGRYEKRTIGLINSGQWPKLSYLV